MQKTRVVDFEITDPAECVFHLMNVNCMSCYRFHFCPLTEFARAQITTMLDQTYPMSPAYEWYINEMYNQTVGSGS